MNWYEPREIEHFSECRSECERYESDDCPEHGDDHGCTCAEIAERRADSEAEAIIELMD